MGRTILSWAALALAILSFPVLSDAKVTVGEAAPAFVLNDLDGNPRSLADFNGKYVVLEWVNYDCPFVRKHYRSGNMQKLQKTYTGRDVVWLSICSSAPGKQGYFELAELKDRMKEFEVAPTAYLRDPDGNVGRLYEAKTTPHMFVIDPKGVVIYAGGIDNKPSTDLDDIATATNYVSAALDAALGDRKVDVTNSKPYGCSVKY